MMSDTADVVVVGAGPAGAWAACLLARQGVRVSLVDASHPREKPCGGGVTGRALALAAQAAGGGAFNAVPIRTARFVETASSPIVEATVALPDGALVVASRTSFDGTLVAAARDAGATLVHSRVRRIERRNKTFHVVLDDGSVITTGHLIGADGANSLTRRTVAAPFSRRQLSIATGFFAHGVTSTEIVVEFRDDPPGYLWSFPRPDHLAIGICAQADAGITSSRLQAIAAQWMAGASLGAGARIESYSWPIPSLSSDDFERLEPAGDGWYLVGDAAGLVDPITREGIYFALESARHAAEAILGGGADAHRMYTERVRSEIATDLAQAARFRALFFAARFRGLLMSALSESEPIRAVMADLVTGTQPYRTLKRRLASTLEFRLAWRLLTRGR